jgi:SAM-dependent methyltransferase
MNTEGDAAEPRLSGDDLQQMYRHRFDDADRIRIDHFWDLFYDRFLREFVPIDGCVLDLGAGSCEFINRVVAARRIAVDLNTDLKVRAAEGVEAYTCSCEDLQPIDDECVDLVFTSNFFEHLDSPEALMATLSECRRVLRPGGTMVVLMPNLRAVGARYYDYLDHKLPVTDQSLVEALSLAGLRPTRVIPRMLPYGANPAGRIRSDASASVVGRLLSNPEVHRTLLSTYLRMKPVWRLFGGQMFVVAVRD